MGFKFEKLIIWQKAMEMGEEMNNFSNSFPKKEIYNLSSQLRRAADSIALNISEGSNDQSNPEFRKFMGYEIRSQAEVVTCLNKAKYRNYISEKEFDEAYKECFNLLNMMNDRNSIFGLRSSDFRLWFLSWIDDQTDNSCSTINLITTCQL